MTQRKQAILMWRMIANNIKFRRPQSFVSISDFKKQFCRQRNLHWRHDCYICQHTRCMYCRLLSCNDSGSAYQIACRTSKPVEQRLRACFDIIEAIRRVDENTFITD